MNGKQAIQSLSDKAFVNMAGGRYVYFRNKRTKKIIDKAIKNSKLPSSMKESGAGYIS
jgi:hypothetical protein